MLESQISCTLCREEVLVHKFFTNKVVKIVSNNIMSYVLIFSVVLRLQEDIDKSPSEIRGNIHVHVHVLRRECT